MKITEAKLRRIVRTMVEQMDRSSYVPSWEDDAAFDDELDDEWTPISAGRRKHASPKNDKRATSSHLNVGGALGYGSQYGDDDEVAGEIDSEYDDDVSTEAILDDIFGRR